MNQEQTLALWEKGKHVWNAWAENMLADRKALENKGEWRVVTDLLGNQIAKNGRTKQWLDDATVIFSGSFKTSSIDDIIDFSGLLFPHTTLLDDAHFQSEVSFWAAQFNGPVTIENCTFREGASIGNAKFRSDVRLASSTFLGITSFERSVFENRLEISNVHGAGRISFRQCDIAFLITERDTRFEGKVDFSLAEFRSIAWFDFIEFRDAAKFQNAVFHKQARFPDVKFLNSARFEGATFKKNALFTNAYFGTSALFHSAKFEESAWFQQTKWKNKIQFQNSEFLGETVLEDAVFDGTVLFNSCLFAKPVRLKNASFTSNASFNSAQIRQAFDISGAKFAEVPDFRQTHCEEAPLLDNVHIASRVLEQDRLSQKPNFTITANYRALKRLAIQGHDHKHEVEFFAQELKARRLMVDTPSDPNWWLSFLFDELSNYGRSIARTLLYWLCTVMLSAVLYIATSTPLDINRAALCFAGAGSQVNTAYQLAFTKGFLIPSFADRTIITQAYDCLYGDIIPGSVSVVAGIQTLLSAILLFLLPLGIRNRFKLK